MIDAQGKRVVEPRDPNESAGFARLVLKKPARDKKF